MLCPRVACVKNAASYVAIAFRDILTRRKTMAEQETATETTAAPETNGRRVWFEICNCGAPLGNHGYFYSAVGGKCPYPTGSMEAAEPLVTFLTEKENLTDEEVAALQQEIVAANLQDKAGDTERAMHEERNRKEDEARFQRVSLDEFIAELLADGDADPPQIPE
jgi:hypothetical protein